MEGSQRNAIIPIVVRQVALYINDLRKKHREETSVGPWITDGNAVIGVAVLAVEIEHKQNVSLLKGKHLPNFVA